MYQLTKSDSGYIFNSVSKQERKRPQICYKRGNFLRERQREIERKREKERERERKREKERERERKREKERQRERKRDKEDKDRERERKKEREREIERLRDKQRHQKVPRIYRIWPKANQKYVHGCNICVLCRIEFVRELINWN